MSISRRPAFVSCVLLLCSACAGDESPPADNETCEGPSCDCAAAAGCSQEPTGEAGADGKEEAPAPGSGGQAGSDGKATGGEGGEPHGTPRGGGESTLGRGGVSGGGGDGQMSTAGSGAGGDRSGGAGGMAENSAGGQPGVAGSGAGGQPGVAGSGAGGQLGVAGSGAGGQPPGTPPPPPPGSCEMGSSETQWATECRSVPHDCVAGTWMDGGPEPSNSALVVEAESEHFVIYRMSHIDLNAGTVATALEFMETEVWGTYFGDPMYMKEPFCDSASKYKNVIHIRDDVGLQGGSWSAAGGSRMGMWVGPAALGDQWGLAHEFMHGVQAVAGGMRCGGGSNYCGWWFESHANWAAHQVNPDNVHCTELMVNAPHLYLGNLRNRYCNWQFAEYLKDKRCYSSINDIWTEGENNDPFSQIMTQQGWAVPEMNDFLAEWAMHNITWDYRDPPPAEPVSKQALFKRSYGDIDEVSGGFGNRGQRRQRKTRLEALNDSWRDNRRFVTNYYWAPQRWGYNTVELLPEPGATEVSLTFKGVEQPGADSGWRYGFVATDAELTTARYGDVHVGSGVESTASFCLNPGERVWLVVMAAPTMQRKINWDEQSYPKLHRYPWMIQLGGAWPAGFENGERACVQGTPHANGGGCVAPGASVAASAYVGPYAQVLGGTVGGMARIEDHAIVLDGSVTEQATVGGLTILSDGFSVSDSATVRATFLPIGWFGARSASGTAELLGDLECYSNKSSGSFTGFVDDQSSSVSTAEVTAAPPYLW